MTQIHKLQWAQKILLYDYTHTQKFHHVEATHTSKQQYIKRNERFFNFNQKWLESNGESGWSILESLAALGRQWLPASRNSAQAGCFLSRSEVSRSLIDSASIDFVSAKTALPKLVWVEYRSRQIADATSIRILSALIIGIRIYLRI